MYNVNKEIKTYNICTEHSYPQISQTIQFNFHADYS